MYKCIYCNSEELTESDIIPYALTGAKLTRKFVCRKHNQFTNDNFEKKTISHWDPFRNILGLRERKGSAIKYQVDIHADGVILEKIAYSGLASIIEDKKRLFHGTQEGREILVGNPDKLKKIKRGKEDDVRPLDLSESVIRFSIDLMQLLASEEMLRTIAKMAYEWYCYIHSVECFHQEEFHEIVECILLEKPVENYVTICVNQLMDSALGAKCLPGNHTFFEYVDVEGVANVVICFWGIASYNVRIYNTGKPNTNFVIPCKLYIYGIDGEKSQDDLTIFGKAKLDCVPATKAVQKNHALYISRIHRLMTTVNLSLLKITELAGDIKEALKIYNREPHDLAAFLDYENFNRVLALKVILYLNEHKAEYNREKSFTENIRHLFRIEKDLEINSDDKKTFIAKLQTMHENNTLASTVEESLLFLNQICEIETQKQNDGVIS